MEHTFLSIIVPVYNVEKYLRFCLDSILNAEFKDYEIILVIGDSSDDSNKICREYQNLKDCSIIEQDGSGLSNARNCGLKYAKGDYIIYIDSDDYIDAKAFDKTIESFCKLRRKNYDVLITDFYLVNANDKIYSCRNQIEETEEIIESYDYLGKFLTSNYTYWNVWRYIYRRVFLLENSLFFKENYKSEDIDYSTSVLLATQKICFFHNPYYCYRIRRTGSLVNVVSIQNIDNLMEILTDSIQKINTSDPFRYKRVLVNNLVREYIFSMALIYDVEENQRNDASNKISQQRNILKYGKSGYFMYYVVGIVGIRNLGRLLYLLRQIRRKMSSN